MAFPELETNLATVRDRIAAACDRSGRADDVTVVAVTKGHPVSAISAAARAGIKDIGENRVHEALGKRDDAADVPVNWHMIGHLQSNKAKFVPGTFATVQSVDSLKLGRALDSAWGKGEEGSEPLQVLLQVNVSGEVQKSGCTAGEASDVAHGLAGLPHLRLTGLMTMAPFTDDAAAVRNTFAATRGLRDELARDLELPILSMGMSGDYELAVEEGSTMVRLGTVLFGERGK